MTDQTWTKRQHELMRELIALIATRTRAEDELESGSGQARDQIDQDFEDRSHNLESEIAEQTAQAHQDYSAGLQRIADWFDPEFADVSSEYRQRLTDIDKQFRTATETAQKTYDDTCWMVNSVFDESANDSPKQKFESFSSLRDITSQQLESELDQLHSWQKAADELLARRRMPRDFDLPSPDLELAPIQEETYEQVREAISAAETSFNRLKKQRLSRLFAAWWSLPLLIVLWGLAAGGLILLRMVLQPPWDFREDEWQMLFAGGGFALGLMMTFALYAIAGSRSTSVYLDFLQAWVDARAAASHWKKLSTAEWKRQKKEFETWYAEIVSTRDAALDKAEKKRDHALGESQQIHDRGLHEVENYYPAKLTELENRKADETTIVEETYKKRLDEITERSQQQTSWLEQERRLNLEEAQRAEASERQHIAEIWRTGWSQFRAEMDSMAEISNGLFSGWETLLRTDLPLPSDIPPVIRIGQLDFDLQSLPNGLPEEPSLQPERPDGEFPFVLSVPDDLSLVIEAAGDGRDHAVDLMQVAMLRLLTALPPGKVRFTIIDPVGLGENFSAFMHLADYDEQLINSRIWTEAGHIEKRLADLTEHMENILQTYLRNEFETIQEYNIHAGEVAEPFHFLVVANFPANFNENAARRLVSIAQSGPRCGVFPLISVDTQRELPHQFNPDDLKGKSTYLKWRKDRFVTGDELLDQLPLVPDQPPEPELFGELVRLSGDRSKNARRVEVPFGRIAPTAGEIFTGDSRSGIELPLGRAGATKLQMMRLGRGTSQHVLVAGKTGSGKSSFLHALITNLALHYSPREVEFYLIDFKKGVEFKSYVTGKLPHARVVGIESDREFGVSALERLDEILKERGDLFRQAGVQDIAHYRNSHPEEILPRILLIVDEFQEFFVEDDRLAQKASLLLDRLVRQGRAFGIHVLLGSQTLGGAYSLARSTLGQMAVRIALQCSETDAHLILSEENTAARLLSRPGEAIYNDANGLVEGNHPFQIAWLDDEQRHEYLADVRQAATERSISVPPPVVFEGNVPADPCNNSYLVQLLRRFASGENWQERPAHQVPRHWVGESVAIHAPPEISFPRQSGSNLLLVGQSAESALGVMTVCLSSLAAQYPALPETSAEQGPAQFTLFVGTEPDSPETACWREWAELLPHAVDFCRPESDIEQTIAALAGELERREEAVGGNDPPLFVAIYSLGRFRQLRRDEDDYGFGGFDRDKAPSLSKQFEDLVRKGPGVGIHVIIWSDTFNNASRWLSTQMLREFEMRIAFRMNSTDSSNFIDSPQGGKLGQHRALLYLAEQGSLEKFRPYGHVPEEWWQLMRECFAGEVPVQETVHSELADPEELSTDDLEDWTII